MSSLRLFVALDLPAPVREDLRAFQAALRREAGAQAADVRWVDPDSVHLTLQFLGAVPEERRGEVEAAVAAAAAQAAPATLRLAGAGAFPSPSRPRVLWAGVAGEVEPLRGLVAALGAGLAPLGYPPEERRFSPHLTLGRARDPRGARGLAPLLSRAPPPSSAPWRAEEVTLFRSHLSPGGARYEPLLRARLGPGG
ncbi:RNA 2',3'-cyclic phosphodiesterase [Anaeromyxobacter paludicola]|uniref:RNA 2',3'-cyclic phosphodiesterase n=1 Tax=Anaeromyxobacter paludicola TaxID=2918171 RepID=A0ABM7XBM7_9BACT|nr:RNA 2',3'-cyclic phosphodiesterase [Anaeromyxobacter paludicola]BDG09263.1 RNA 2',3'-cyclic phosphodiesterase [Anaeromyxobacter paludicola]